MGQNTTVQTKKEFIEMISSLMSDDQVVLWTQNTSTIELKPKLNEKRVTLGFSADAFDRKDAVNDLMGLRGYLLGVVICDRSILSDGAKSLVPTKPKSKK